MKFKETFLKICDEQHIDITRFWEAVIFLLSFILFIHVTGV